MPATTGSGGSQHRMAKSDEPITIKKYANRRLYNTGTSTYVTLEDLATMVKAGENFIVYDAKTNEDITRSVLTQIIFEQENKEGGQNLLPINFLRQLIRFYGDSMQMMVPRYLEVSLDSLTQQQSKFRDQVSQAFGMGGFGSIEEQVAALFKKLGREFWPVRENLHLSDEQKANAIKKVAVDSSTLLGRKVVSVDRTDGAKFVFDDGSWMLLRLSGTEPLLRLYIEADSAKASAKLTEEATKWVLAT